MSVAAESGVTAPTRREWFALAVLSVGLGMIVLDGTIVGVALPDIIKDLHKRAVLPSDATWRPAIARAAEG